MIHTKLLHHETHVKCSLVHPQVMYWQDKDLSTGTKVTQVGGGGAMLSALIFGEGGRKEKSAFFEQVFPIF